MRIAVEGCCHGQLDEIYRAIEERERHYGYKVDLLLICGDFHSIRNEADLDTIACPRKYLHLGTFHKYYSGERKVPVPTVFIGGNHESSNYLWELYHGGWVCPDIYFLGWGGVINVGGLRIGGMSGIYKSGHYETGHYEVTPYNDNHKRSVYHVRKYDVYKMLQVKEPLHVFLSHDWPLGIEQYGNTAGLLRAKKFFTKEVQENTLGSKAYEQVLASVRPAHWFSAHLHVRFTAIIYWDAPGHHGSEPGPSQQHLQQNLSVAELPAVLEAVKNPDEIDINFDEDEATPAIAAQSVQNPDEIEIDMNEEHEQGSAHAVPQSAAIPALPVASNPEEIQIEMDDESDEDISKATTQTIEQSALQAPQQQQQQQQQQPSLITTTTPKLYPTCTKFLALDKCMPNRKFLEIIDLPEFNEPLEFKYDEEWLAIVRTLDPFLSLEHKQRPPLQGNKLQHALDVNREWVRENVTKKRGLAIPLNFQPTAPAHDAVRTMGPQEKQDCMGEYYRQLQNSRTQGAGHGASSERGRGRGRGARGHGGGGGRGSTFKRHRGERNAPVEVKFAKATAHRTRSFKQTQDSGDGDDESDEGLRSDEIDESEEELLMQEFDWIEEDQDPDQKNLTIALPQLPIAEPVIPITGWGGALAYQSLQPKNRGRDPAEDVVEFKGPPTGAIADRIAASSRISVVAGQNIDADADADAGQPSSSTTGVSAGAGALTTVRNHKRQHKKPKIDPVDLSTHVQIKMTLSDVPTNTQDNLEQPLWVMDTTPDTMMANDNVLKQPMRFMDAESGSTTPLNGASAERMDVDSSRSGKIDSQKQRQERASLQLHESEEVLLTAPLETDVPMWVMDTVGETIAAEEINEAYIELPILDDNQYRKRRKGANRSKRGGRKQKERDAALLKAMKDSGDILLEEQSSEDDDMKAVEDYMQNIQDSDNEDGLDSFMESFAGLHSDLGHSNHVGGLDPDDSDFQESASEIDSQEDEDFDFTSKSRERRRQQGLDKRLSRVLDRALSPSWPESEPQGYEYYLPEDLDASRWREKGQPHGGSKETLEEINSMIEKFVKDHASQSLRLPTMMKPLRRRVHLLSELYNLRSESLGSGKSRFAVLMKTHRTRVPENTNRIQLLFAQSDQWVQERAAEFGGTQGRGSRGSGRGRGRGRGAAGGRIDRYGHNSGDRDGWGDDGRRSKGPSKHLVANGTVVGASADPISATNVGHRLLAKMGWTPGGGLGASGSGITQPIEAVMKRTRRGLGHETAKHGEGDSRL
ncbi:hypothetical protein EDD11_006044 [Mortierella claussenii]|nr:hypothetical protein EDD11_006044 [Mortierella claussenii]